MMLRDHYIENNMSGRVDTYHDIESVREYSTLENIGSRSNSPYGGRKSEDASTSRERKKT